MSSVCHKLHELFHKFERHHFPYDVNKIPQNGIYILFEKDEPGHEADRIVRIGTHTGSNQLRSRLKQHFVNENKDRSIFRKNVGRCILNKNNDKYLGVWELDSTAREGREQNKNKVNIEYQQEIEKEITKYIQDKFSFCVIEVNDEKDRIKLESKLISTVAQCRECGASKNWFGLYSPKEKIRESGLWQVNELNHEPLSEDEVEGLKHELNDEDEA